VPGLSETIRVISLVGRILEHSRIYYFHNGGEEEVLVGSADLMERNLDRRVEILTPVLHPGLRHALKTRILDLQLRDNISVTELDAEGVYRPVRRGDAPVVDAQLEWATKDLSLMG